MGVLELYEILFGGAWVTKELFKEAGERGVEKRRSELIKQYVAEHTDLELEERLMREVESPSKYNEVWERIENFKRENPVYCKREADKSWKKKYDGTYGYFSRFGWQDVGYSRLEFRTSKGSLYGKTQREDILLEGNRNIAVYLLMQTYGKMKLSHAKTQAENMYRPQRSK